MSVRPRLVVLAAVLLAVSLPGCHPARPESRLTTAERERLSATDRFEDLFREVRHARLGGDESQPLSARPLLKAIDADQRFVVLDKLNVREIYLFEADGSPAGEIGREGRGEDAFIYPHAVTYDRGEDLHYVYDGDLMRIQRFDGDGRFLGLVPISLRLDQILTGPGDTLYGYTSRIAYQTGPGDVVYVLDRDGEVVRNFAPQSKEYTTVRASEGGGIAWAGGHLYVATPYELVVRAYTPRGRLAARQQPDSEHYTPPTRHPRAREGESDFALQIRYHSEWSHVRQLLVFNDSLVGIVFAEAGEERVFLYLFDLDLTPLTEVELPPYLGDLLVEGDRLYLFSPDRRTEDGSIRNPTVFEYRLDLEGGAA